MTVLTNTINAKLYLFLLTDSDKENSEEKANITRNTSDIKAYQLLIEANTTPKRFNDSINKIVNNLSLLNKLKHKNSFNDSLKKPLNYYKHRLTRNIQSPILQKSPLCSTPFKVKYRGESIFKFSPISLTNDDDNSPKYTTITEDNDDSNNSIVFLGNNKTRGSKDAKENTPPSAVKDNSITCSRENDEVIPEIETNAEEVFHRDNTNEEKENIEIVGTSNVTSSVEISSFQTTEVEPFLGFSNKEIINLSLDKISNLDDTVPRNEVTKIEVNENSANAEVDGQYNFSTETNNVKEDNNTSLESDNDDKDSLYDTCNSDQSSIEEKEVIKEPIVKIRRMNDSSFMRYYKKKNDFESDGDDESLKDEDQDNCNDSLEDEVNDEMDVSRYAINISRDEEIAENNISGAGEEIPENNVSQNDEDLSQDEEFASFEDSTASNDQISESGSGTEVNVGHNLLQNEASEYIDIVSSNDDDGESNEEEKCVSFVTTRRRNEVTNNSMMSIFNDSYASSSTDCDKTVLSNKQEPSDKENTNENETLINLNEDKQVISDQEELELRKDVDHPIMPSPTLPNPKEKEDRISFVTTRNSNVSDRKSSIRNRKSSIKPRRTTACDRKSRNLPKESIVQSPESSRNICSEKPGIVLQPGKKWERSLSIFRRMTMMTDHFDQSILEEESTEKKGRKYRQSVIETMERQELNGKYILLVYHHHLSGFL